jgi:hypothetical protein
MTIAVAVSRYSECIRSLLLGMRASVAKVYADSSMPRLLIVASASSACGDVDGWSKIVINDASLPTVPERVGVWPPEYRLALAADCLRARAYNLAGEPVWACDADVRVRKPFPDLPVAAALPVYDGVRRWRDVIKALWDDWLTTINCWYQACDLADAFDQRFEQALSICDCPGEAAAYQATMDVGGMVLPRERFGVAQCSQTGFREDAHAWHYGHDRQRELMSYDQRQD